MRRRLVLVGVVVAGLIAGGCQVNPGDPGAADVTFDIVANGSGSYPISPLVYGTNDPTALATNRQAAVRLGGNRWTAYNWENNASNAGSDYCFENDGFLAASNVAGAAVRPTVDQARAAGASAIVTVPIGDYVAADKYGGCDVRNSGADYLQTRFRRNVATKGSAFSLTPDAADAVVYQDEFVHWLKSTEPGANVVFDLDNEPDLWSSTHAEVHPSPVTYAEIAARSVTYASAIKNVWPASKVAGPVSYGFYGYERLQGAPDAANRNFLDWWLDQMRSAGTAAGHRLIDYLDLHWYPEATGGGVRITSPDNSAAVVAAREQAPRSLWDPSYVENSWITDPAGYNYGAIDLIPRMRDRIAAHYPGTALSFTEWNYGGGDHISGAIASADVLGTFGRERVGLADLWPLNSDESYSYAALRAFRNYDGAGSTFGDRSASATSSNGATASVYASTFAADPNKVVIVAINKALSPRSAAVRVTAPISYATAKVFTITAAGGANVVANPTITPSATNAWLYAMPAQSVSVIVPQA